MAGLISKYSDNEMNCRKIKDRIWEFRDGPDREIVEKHLADCPECRQAAARAEKLLGLLRDARGPEPSPEYLAAFWHRLREKLSPRRPAILHPLYYGGLAAAAAALVLWVSLTGPDGGGEGQFELPVYALDTPSYPAGKERAETSYVSGRPREDESRRQSGIDYVLPRITAGATRRLEV